MGMSGLRVAEERAVQWSWTMWKRWEMLFVDIVNIVKQRQRQRRCSAPWL